MTSWAHATGIFFWALVASTALGSLFKSFPAIKTSLTLAGAVFLIYLAFTSWRGSGENTGPEKTSLPASWVSGLSISFLNPKILIFFTALFSQFIPAQAGLLTLLGMAMLAGLVDGTWYSLVSLLVGQIGLEKSLSAHSLLINRLAAGLYLIIAVYSLSQITGGMGW